MNIDAGAVDSLIRNEQCRPPLITESSTCAITPMQQDTRPNTLPYYASQRMVYPPPTQETTNSVATLTDNSPCNNICPEVLTAIEHAIDSLTPSCCRRGCRIQGAQVLMCAAEGCGKVIHDACYRWVVNRNKDMDLLPAGTIVCTKKCHKIHLRSIKSQVRDVCAVKDVPWDRDGRRGENDPNTSMAVLLDWWTSEGN